VGRFVNDLKYGPNRPKDDPKSWDGREHVLYDRLIYVSTDGREYVVPKGFCTDGASIPRAFWNVLRPFDKYIEAAVLHDYLYAHPEAYSVDRKLADDLFLEAMEACGVRPWKRRVIWNAVRCFASSRYEGSSKENRK
jgi:hypothetical protein